MTKKTFISLFIAVLATVSLRAQYVNDALSFSLWNPQGTARFTGMGGAMSAIGGDFSSVSINPAAIAVFNQEELHLSANIQSGQFNTQYFGNAESNLDNAFTLSHLGINGLLVDDNNKRWGRVSVGINFNRVADFNEFSRIEGVNPNSSYADVFTANAQGTSIENLNSFNTGLAWDTYLIDTAGSINNYASAVVVPGQTQIRRRTTSGGIHELGISLGGIYEGWLFLGGSINFPVLNYQYTDVYTESEFTSPENDIDNWTYQQNLNVEGSGINLKVGAIAKLFPWLRLSMAVHTPSYIAIEETYSSEIETQFQNGANFESLSPISAFDYRVFTPWRFNFGGAFVILKSGVISAEYEMAQYNQMHLGSRTYDFRDENIIIDSLYHSGNTLRLGTEWRFGPVYVRGGYQYRTSPFGPDSDTYALSAVSGGLGLRFDRFTIDGTIVTFSSQREELLYPTNDVNAETATTDFSKTNVIFSFSYRL